MKSQIQEAFQTALLKNDSDSLYELKRQVDSLLEHPGWELVMDLVGQRIEQTQMVMERGLHQHPEYTSFIGEIRGMRTAEYAAKAVLSAAQFRAEEDKQLVAQMAAGDTP